MEGIIGLILIVVGIVLIYDVVAGKAQSIVGLFNGQTASTSTSTSPATQPGGKKYF